MRIHKPQRGFRFGERKSVGDASSRRDLPLRKHLKHLWEFLIAISRSPKIQFLAKKRRRRKAQISVRQSHDHDAPGRSRDLDGLPHRLLRSYSLDDHVCSFPIGKAPNLSFQLMLTEC